MEGDLQDSVYIGVAIMEYETVIDLNRSPPTTIGMPHQAVYGSWSVLGSYASAYMSPLYPFKFNFSANSLYQWFSRNALHAV